MNTNCRSAYGLKIPAGEENYATVSPIKNFSLCGKNAYTLSLAFYYTGNEDGDILTQDDSFKITFKDKHLRFYAQNFANLNLDVDELLVKNSFNSFDVTYANSTLTFYINGIDFYRFSTTPQSQLGVGDFIIGKTFNGYIKRFLIANVSLTKEEIVANLQKVTTENSKLELSLDFNAIIPVDKSKNHLNFTAKAFCVPTNIAHAMSFCEKGALTPMVSPAVTDKFTILGKFYISTNGKNEEYLFSFGQSNQANFVAVGLKKQEDVRLFLKFGNREVISTTMVDCYSWVDVALTYQNKTYKLFLNGEEVLQDTFELLPALSANLTIGNSSSSSSVDLLNFSGYMDYLSVFSDIKTCAELKTYISIPPFVLDKNIVALYLLNTPHPIEIIKNIGLNLSGGACVKLVENTCEYAGEQNIDFQMDRQAIQIPERDRWEGETLIALLADYITLTTGAKPRFQMSGTEHYPDAVINYFCCNIASLDESQSLLNDISLGNPFKIATLTKKLVTIGIFSSIMVLLCYITGSIFAAAFMVASAYAVASFAAITIGIMAVVTIVAVIAKVRTKDPPDRKPDDPPYPPLKPKVYSADVDSVTFFYANSAASALHIKKSATTPTTTPEYVRNSPNTGSVCYAKSFNTTPTIKAKFNCKSSAAVSVTITATPNMILGTFTSTFNLSASGVVEKDISLTANTIATAKLGKHAVKINWLATFSDGKQIFMGTTNHTIIILPAKPLLPFDNSQNLLDFETLSLACTAFGDDASAGNLVAKISSMLLNHTKIRGVRTGQDYYSQLRNSGCAFNLVAFNTAYAAGNVSLTPLDTSMLCCILARACGVSLEVVTMTSMLPPIFYNPDNSYVLTYLFSNQLKCCGETASSEFVAVDRHYANATMENQNIGLIYDAFYKVKLKSGDFAEVIGKPFADTISYVCGAENSAFYRETLFKSGCCCFTEKIIAPIQCLHFSVGQEEIPNEIILFNTHAAQNSWEIKNNADDLSISLNSFVVTNNTIARSINARLAFEQAFDSFLPAQAGWARCHYISYNTICDGILAPILDALANTIAVNVCNGNLQGIRNAVFVGAPVVPAYEALQFNSATININLIIAELNNARNINTISSAANNLLSALNNCLRNVRYGSVNWNFSVQNGYDCDEWIHCDAMSVIDASHLGLGQIPAGAPQPPPGHNIFCIIGANDTTRLNILKTQTRGFNNFFVFIGQDNTINRMNFIFSSSNNFSFSALYSPSPHRVYYLDTTGIVPTWAIL